VLQAKEQLKQRITQSVVVLFTVMAIIGTVFCANSFAAGAADDPNAAQVGQKLKEHADEGASDAVAQYALVAAAAAFGLGAIGAGIAISHVGAAAMGAVAEKPQIAGQALIFVALAEGIVVFGFITAIMILNKA
jgi:V/A-type H+-transporting ATPase subunit K